jgi:predicted acetyltransferase
MVLTEDAERRPAQVDVTPATRDDELILSNLLELYAYDFSEFQQLDLNSDGRFGYKHLPLYWSEAHRYPFLVKTDAKLAGFVFLKRGSEVSGNAMVWDMAEFFILRAYRRRGIGTDVAHQVWRRFPGAWEVRVMESNNSAYQFWERTISAFGGEPIRSVPLEKGGKRWHVFSFESKQLA